jgi:hypothetical protein
MTCPVESKGSPLISTRKQRLVEMEHGHGSFYTPVLSLVYGRETRPSSLLRLA